MNNYKFSSEMHDAEPTIQDEKIEKVEKKELKTKIEPKIEPKKIKGYVIVKYFWGGEK